MPLGMEKTKVKVKPKGPLPTLEIIPRPVSAIPLLRQIMQLEFCMCHQQLTHMLFNWLGVQRNGLRSAYRLVTAFRRKSHLAKEHYSCSCSPNS